MLFAKKKTERTYSWLTMQFLAKTTGKEIIISAVSILEIDK